MRRGYSRNPGRGVEFIGDPDELQKWCDDYLSPDVWKSLRSTILQERKRGNDEVTGRRFQNLSISNRTLKELHKIQDELSHKQKVTLDQLIHSMAVKFSDKSAVVILRELEIQNEFDL